MAEQTEQKPIFDPDNLPRFVPPPGLIDPPATQYYDEVCCPDPVCEQRDYNRACLLLLSNLSRSYAAMLLAREATQQLWMCDSAGHTVGCTDPTCVFGREMDASMALAQRHFERTVVGIFVHLSTVSVDLTPQWQEFADAEQFFIGLQNYSYEPDAVLYREGLRDLAVDGNEVDRARWFRPPPGGPAS